MLQSAITSLKGSINDADDLPDVEEKSRDQSIQSEAIGFDNNLSNIDPLFLVDHSVDAK